MTSIKLSPKNQGGILNNLRQELDEAQVSKIMAKLKKYGIVVINRVQFHNYMHKRHLQYYES